MYEVSLTKNVNLKISDLDFEFTPSRNVKIFTDEEFNASNDIKKFIGDFFSVKQIDDAQAAKKVVPEAKAKPQDIVELPVPEAKKEDDMKNVVNATGASKNNSETVREEVKTLEEEANTVDDTIVDATNASKTGASETKNVVVEEVKTEEVKTDEVNTTTDDDKTSKKTTKQSRKSNSKKK